MRKNIFKILILLFICAIPFSVYSEDADDNSVNILKEIGVFERMGASVEDNSKLISRIDFVSMCKKLICPDITSAKYEQTIFTDIDVNSEKGKNVIEAYNLGWISMPEDKKFNPDGYITYSQAIKVIVTAMGYKLEAEAGGGYPKGYLQVADRLDISVNSCKTDEALSFEAFSEILLNALEAKICNIEIGEDANYNINYSGGQTLMYSTMNMRKARGILSGNNFTTLKHKNGLGHDQVQIGDFVGFVFSGFMPESYIGYEVEYYYLEEEDGNYVMYMEPTSKNKVITVLSEDAEPFYNGTFSYYSGSRKKTVSIPRTVCIVYNGRSEDELLNEYYVNKDAEIRLIDNNNDDKIDVINIFAWDNIYVYSVDKENGKIIDKYNKSSNITVDLDDGNILWNSDFREIKIDEINVGDIITVIKSSDGKYLRGIVQKDAVSGKVTAVSEKDDIRIKIDGTEYIIAKSYVNKNSFNTKPGDSITAKLDYYGRIAAIEAFESEFEYYYIIKAYENDDNEELLVKLMTPNGSVKIAECAEKMVVDGKVMKEMDDAGDIRGLLNSPQIVRILMNNGEIKNVDTLKNPDKDDNSLRALTELKTMTYFSEPKVFVGSGNNVEYSSEKVIYAQTIMGPETRLYVVPNPEDENYLNEKLYGVYDSSYFTGGTNTAEIQAYTSVADSFIPEVIMVVNTEALDVGRGQNASVVKEICTVLNSEQEAVRQITVMMWYAGSLVERSYEMANEAELLEMNLKVGDCIQFSTNILGQINKINRIYSYEKHDFDPENTATPDTYYGQNFVPFSGYAYSREKNVFQYTKNVPDNASASDVYYLPTGSNTKIIVVENGRTVKQGTFDDIYDYVHYGTGDKLFFTVSQGHTRMIVVYKQA